MSCHVDASSLTSSRFSAPPSFFLFPSRLPALRAVDWPDFLLKTVPWFVADGKSAPWLTILPVFRSRISFRGMPPSLFKYARVRSLNGISSRFRVSQDLIHFARTAIPRASSSEHLYTCPTLSSFYPGMTYGWLFGRLANRVSAAGKNYETYPSI